MTAVFPWVEAHTVDVHADALDALDAHILDALPDVTSLLVARRGKLVFERCYDGLADTPRDTQSVTKSALSLLVGIALDQGVLRDLDQAVLPLLVADQNAVHDPRWHGVTVRHLLTMTCGLPSELTDPGYDEAWFTAPDPVRFSLAQPLLDPPGTTFRYSNAGVHLLGAALESAAHRPLASFAQDTLFTPLGIAAPHWPTDPQGRPFACGGLHLTPRHMLALGQLVLQRGVWHLQRLVSPSWIAESTRPHLQGFAWMEGLPDYGLLWWCSREHGVEGWYMTGYGGQYVAVFPTLDLVVVMTGRVGDHASHRHVIVELVRTAIR